MARKRKKTRLCIEGWYYLVVAGFLLAGSLLREINLLLLIFALMLSLLLWSWRHVAVSLRKVALRRELPRAVTAGEMLVVDLHATNDKRRTSWAVVVEDKVHRETVGRASRSEEFQARPKVVFSRLGPRESASQAYDGRLTQRGRYGFGPLKVSTRFPLGLIRRTQWIDQDASLLVLPRLGQLTPKWYRRNQKDHHGSRSVKHRQGLTEGDFHSLRDYRPGDSHNWIHWRTSARHGELMVRQFEQQRNHDLTLFLDLWQPQEPQREHRDNVELAVSFAATILADQCRRGGHQLLLGVAGAENSFTRGPASTALLHGLLERLALAEASPADRLPGLLEEGLDQMPLRSDLVLISTRPGGRDNTTRFADSSADPRKQSAVGQMLVIHSAGQDLFEYFQPQ